MLTNRVFGALSAAAVALLLSGCGTKGLNSVQVSPATQSVSVGQTVQFTAVGTFGNGNRPSTKDVTSTVAWSSSVPSVATVNASGVATAVAAGTTVISAKATAFNGPVSSSGTLTVTGSTGGGGSGGSILSLTIIPSGIKFGSLGESGQYLAIGTFSTTPTVRDVTNSVTWFTSDPNGFPVTNNNSAPPGGGTQNGGVVSAWSASNGDIGAIITAEATDSNGSIATATATVGCPLVLPNPPSTPGSCYQVPPFPLPLLVTLTVYNEGLNITNWEVTAPSATGTANVLHCGPGWALNGGTGSVCTATYPYGSTVTLTAPATGAAFGGWSSNCANTGTITATGPNNCTVTLTTDDTVGAVFN